MIEVSIIIPCRNEEKFIARCLDSVLAQDFPKNKIEVIVVDGMSEDKTREIIKSYSQKYCFIKLLDNYKKNTSCALNVGIKKSNGKVIIRLDAHANYDKDYVSKSQKYLKKYNADNVGGAVRTVPAKNTLIAKAIAICLSHKFGVGNSRFRKGTNKKQWVEVDTVFGGCYHKEVFKRIGYYNENLIRSQDMELNLRLKKAGGKILLAPNIVSYYYPKATLKDFFLHNIQDGIWAIYPLKFGVSLKLRHYMPLIFILTLPISIWPYLLINFLFSFMIALQKRNLKYLIILPLAFLARHIGYGIGSLLGTFKLFKAGNRMVKLPQSDLTKRVRKFWYSNTEGDFDLNGEKISRKDIFTYGGPNPKFTCNFCQIAEWLSRIRQKNLFKRRCNLAGVNLLLSHSCSQSKECETLCSHQGDEMWTHHHQNFDFMFGCDNELPSPKCLYLNDVPTKAYKRFTIPRCDQGGRVFRRQWAYACQVDMVQKLVDIDWSKYDFMFVDISGCREKFTRPDIPIILYGHDYWGDPVEYQKIIDWLQPDMFLTSYTTQWKENLKFPDKTKIAFFPLFSSTFFNRPNLGEKKFDLLVIGALCNPLYKARVSLNKQIAKLSDKYKVEFSHRLGTKGSKYTGENHNYLNKWSEYIASAKYVIFGRIADPKKQVLLFKYYETLGSGAIPIFPKVPDLELLGVEPFVHYIPLSMVEDDNKILSYYLDNYDKYKYIAKNAVKWYNTNADKAMFEGFEDTIHQVVNKYDKRKI